jgi:hypothetical protein
MNECLKALERPQGSGVRGQVRALGLADMSAGWKAATRRRTPNLKCAGRNDL